MRGRNPGRMRERLEIQRKVQTTDAGGGRSAPTWTPYATVQAEVRPVSSFKRLNAAQAGAPVDHEVVIHHRDDVDSRDRFLWVSRTPGIALTIVTGPVNRDARRRYLHFDVVEDRD